MRAESRIRLMSNGLKKRELIGAYPVGLVSKWILKQHGNSISPMSL